MSDTPDPAGPQRQEVESYGSRLTALAIAAAVAGRDPESDPEVLRAARRLAVIATLAAVTSRWPRTQKKSTDPIMSSEDEAALQSRIAATAVKEVSKFARAAAARMPEATPSEREDWAESVGQTYAARVAGDAVLAMADPISKDAGEPMKTMWLSRADAKVRPLHRKLTGQTREIGKPYWREMGTGKTLSFPGDPSAPLDETVNCRCWLVLVPASQASKAEELFQVPESDFALAASIDPAIMADLSS